VTAELTEVHNLHRTLECNTGVPCTCGSPDARDWAKCPRHADILRCARELYGDVRWGVTPEGMLQEIGSDRKAGRS
jgi:hypothetical protein